MVKIRNQIIETGNTTATIHELPAGNMGFAKTRADGILIPVLRHAVAVSRAYVCGQANSDYINHSVSGKRI